MGPSAGITDGLEAENFIASTLKFSVSDNGVTVNGANVISTDILVNNGIVHVIDKVLLPGGDDSSTCADLFCKDGVTNGSVVIDQESGMTCDSLNGALGILKSDDAQCTQALMAEALCCPSSTEQECFVCGGKDVAMGEPDRVIPGATTCKGIDTDILAFTPIQGCD